MIKEIDIRDFSYALPDERIAKFPLPERDASKLLIYRNGQIGHHRFGELAEFLPSGALLIFNNTKVIHARLFFFKESGAKIEIFCLEPHQPADHEHAFTAKGKVQWRCMVGNLKKWKSGTLTTRFALGDKEYTLTAEQKGREGNDVLIEFRFDACGLTFGQLLEHLGKIPIPPYLNRESQASDNLRYQTIYSKFDGSVAAPTAGLHFTERSMERLRAKRIERDEVTLHVGAGTFLPVKSANAAEHPMHTERFRVSLATLHHLIEKSGDIFAVGTTSVRTLESLTVLGHRILTGGDPRTGEAIGQWEAYGIPAERSGRELLEAIAGYLETHGRTEIEAATRIMIVPGYRFRVVEGLVTNFHQPESTLLLLIAAVVGPGKWRAIYDYALEHDFRFLSYGDSSLLFRYDGNHA